MIFYISLLPIQEFNTNKIITMIKVGRCEYKNGRKSFPSYENYESIIAMSGRYKYSDLSPFRLTDDNGRNMENLWQFSKVYQYVPRSTQRYSRYDNRVIWKHPKEIHVIQNPDGTWKLTNEYYKWREKGMNNPDAVRYPVGRNNAGKCLFSLKNTPDGSVIETPLNYIEARKQIYLPTYVHLVKKHDKFKILLDKINKGQNLLIIGPDGPHQESLPYYKDKYNVSGDFIDKNTMTCNRKNLNIMLNDPKHPFGHCYCLALALLMNM